MEKNRPEAFVVFDEWLHQRYHLRFVKKEKRKELWKEFVDEVKRCGIINVFNCKDYNKLKELLGLPYVDKEGWIVNGAIRTKGINLNEKEKDN